MILISSDLIEHYLDRCQLKTSFLAVIISFIVIGVPLKVSNSTHQFDLFPHYLSLIIGRNYTITIKGVDTVVKPYLNSH